MRTLIASTLILLAVRADAQPEPPTLPQFRSPVALFRELLAMSPAEQSDAIERRFPEKRAVITRKLDEYRALDPAILEQKLFVTEMHYFVVPLLNVPSESRRSSLGLMTANVRVIVSEKLKQWDQLPTRNRDEILANSKLLGWFLQDGVQPPMPPMPVGNNDSFSVRPPLPTPELQAQADLADRVNAILELPASDRSEFLEKVDPAARAQITDIVARLNQVPEVDRSKCVASFVRIALMAPDERRRFLASADAWVAIPDKSKRLWRNVVPELPPVPRPLQLTR